MSSWYKMEVDTLENLNYVHSSFHLSCTCRDKRISLFPRSTHIWYFSGVCVAWGLRVRPYAFL